MGASAETAPQDTLEDAWLKFRMGVVTKETSTLATGSSKDEDELKQLHPKDVKPPPEFGGSRKEFMPWHESFTSMLRLRSMKWTKIVSWLTTRREKRLQDDRVKADFVEYQFIREPDEYIEKNFELKRRQYS